MIYALTWLPTVLESAGLKIALTDGWESRGHGDVGKTLGVICHHTAGSKNGNMPTLNLLIEGRSDLTGPLSQLGLGRDGTYYIIAAGRCYHAGSGNWKGVRTGNTNFIGIEAENCGNASDPWPDIQLDAYKRGVAAILKHLHLDASDCCGHYEYAEPKGRKSDPHFSMDEFRSDVARIINGEIPPRPLIPRVEPGENGRPTLRRGAKGALVEFIQRKIGAQIDGDFGAITEAALRNFQRQQGLVPDGIVGPKTWKLLGN